MKHSPAQKRMRALRIREVAAEVNNETSRTMIDYAEHLERQAAIEEAGSLQQ